MEFQLIATTRIVITRLIAGFPTCVAENPTAESMDAAYISAMSIFTARRDFVLDVSSTKSRLALNLSTPLGLISR
jgi:hypothetical protein